VIGTSTTAADGIARFLYTIPINAVPSVKEVIFQYEEDTPRVYEAIATPLTILQGDTQISRFPVQGKAGKNVRVTARLRSGSLVIPNKALTFELNGSIIGSGTTGADGVVSIIFTIPADFAPGDKSITIRFGGDPSFKAVSGTTKLTVIP
jgi:hypothetical protein